MTRPLMKWKSSFSEALLNTRDTLCTQIDKDNKLPEAIHILASELQSNRKPNNKRKIGNPHSSSVGGIPRNATPPPLTPSMLGRGRKLSRLIRPPWSTLVARAMPDPVERAPYDFVALAWRCTPTLEVVTARDAVRCIVDGTRPHPREAYPSACFDRVVTCEMGGAA